MKRLTATPTCPVTGYAASTAQVLLRCGCDVCKAWRREYYRRLRAANPERARNVRRTWNMLNKDKVREHQRRWRAKKRAELADKLAAVREEQS